MLRPHMTRTGVLLGLLLTPPLIAVMYVARTILGLPFSPFDLFEWLTRILPGRIVIGGIDALAAVLTIFGLSLRTASKTAEQMLALALFTGGGAGVAAVVARLLATTRLRDRNPVTWAVGASAGVGAVVAILTAGVRPMGSLAPLWPASIWIVLAFGAWGFAFGRAWRALHPSALPGRGARISLRDAVASTPARSTVTLDAADRRVFLVRLAGAAASITVVGAALALLQRRTAAPSAGTPNTALPPRPGAVDPAPGTRPEYTPVCDHYRIDINLFPPHIDVAAWTLPITGRLDRPARLTLEGFEKGAYGPAHDHFITLSCISNPVAGDLIGTTRWTGVSLKAVLAPLGVQSAARFVTVHAADGFHETMPLDRVAGDERIMLAYHWDGERLTPGHGFPLRLYIPDRYGMKQPKWITAIEVMDHYEAGYWVVRGWDETAQVLATSVIDTVAIDDAYEKDGRRFVPIGGMAYAGARGISKVEIKVDGGPWIEARLRQPLSDLTWVLWRYDWMFAPGRHTFAVRCYDGQGQPQIAEDQGTYSRGATGIHRLDKRLGGVT